MIKNQPQICWTPSLFLYSTSLENHSFPFQIVKHNLKMLQTFSQPQHTFKYLVRGKTFCTALTSKSNQSYTGRAGYVNALGRAESRSETLSLDHGGIFWLKIWSDNKCAHLSEQAQWIRANWGKTCPNIEAEAARICWACRQVDPPPKSDQH